MHHLASAPAPPGDYDHDSAFSRLCSGQYSYDRAGTADRYRICLISIAVEFSKFDANLILADCRRVFLNRCLDRFFLNDTLDKNLTGALDVGLVRFRIPFFLNLRTFYDFFLITAATSHAVSPVETRHQCFLRLFSPLTGRANIFDLWLFSWPININVIMFIINR